MVQEGISSGPLVEHALRSCGAAQPGAAEAASLQQLQAVLQRIDAKGAEGALPVPDAEVSADAGRRLAPAGNPRGAFGGWTVQVLC